jgi:hypothetical protein
VNPPGRLASGIDVFRPGIAALAVTSLTALSAMPAASAAQAPAPAAGSVVAAGPARSMGEPAAAQDSSVSAVVATSFGAAGARATVWTRQAGSRTWREAGAMLPDGFGTSYDASAAALPGGPLLLVAGTAPPGKCIADGSVGIADVSPGGRVSGIRLVSDQRGTGNFDDRPAVAAAAGGLVWVAWSQGRNTDSCQDVGQDDRLAVATSHDGGATFGTPVTMPTIGGRAAFGARLAPLAGGRVAVSWTETMPGGDEAVLVSVLGPGHQVSTPRIVLRGDALPLVLPGASFYDFPAGAIAALPDGTLVVAAPLWHGGRGVVEVAAGTPGGPWRTGVVRPPRDADLLLPALGALGTDGVLLVCAVHYRTGDRLGYASASLPAGTLSAPLATLTAAPAGPGFFEIGEEGSMTATPTGLIAPVVVAGSGTSTLETFSWTVAPPRPARTPASSSSARAGQPRHPPASSAAVRAAQPGGMPRWLQAAIAAAVILTAAAAWAAARRLRIRRGPGRDRPRHSARE